ncbi:SgcJ/EcaC family oxidoreductase [Nocardiopsis alba]|uniref:SgcJ/EcaC family oxidoreductase n=1 Tax=Nocardiopsis alba TaxID=53437 RepID=UPI00366A6EBE
MANKVDESISAQAGSTSLSEVPKRMMEAWKSNSADAFAALFTEDATMVLPGMEFRSSKNEIHAFMEAQYAGPLKGTKVMGTPLSVRVLDGDNAVLITRGGVISPGEDGVAPEREIQATWVLRREGKIWLISAYHNSPVQAP